MSLKFDQTLTPEKILLTYMYSLSALVDAINNSA